MKIRLTGITEEPAYANVPTDNQPQGENPLVRITMARCELVWQLTPTPYSVILIPYKAVEGAQVGDEFTMYLERVKK